MCGFFTAFANRFQQLERLNDLAFTESITQFIYPCGLNLGDFTHYSSPFVTDTDKRRPFVVDVFFQDDKTKFHQVIDDALDTLSGKSHSSSDLSNGQGVFGLVNCPHHLPSSTGHTYWLRESVPNCQQRPIQPKSLEYQGSQCFAFT